MWAEHDGVRKATTRPLGCASSRRCPFEQVEYDDPYVEHFPGHAGDLYPITDSNSYLPIRKR